MDKASSSTPEFHSITVRNGTPLLPENAQRTSARFSSTIHGAECMDKNIFFIPGSSSFSVESCPAVNSDGSGRHFSDHSLSPPSSSPRKGRSNSFQNNSSHSNYYLCSPFTSLGSNILSCLRVGCKWFLLFLALSCYSILIMPGLLQVAYYYFFSKQIRRNIAYGELPRNKLDLYIPTNGDGLKPVVAVVTGGAWVLGYRAWGALLGRQLSENGIIVACIDYRNFPRATIGDMVKDASHGISFIYNNISEFGGDPNRIYLMGQSAGAHIAACALVEQASKEAGRENISWSTSNIKAYFGLSGGYNLFDVIDQFDRRWLCRSFLLRIMEGEQSLKRFSPQLVIQDPNFKAAASLLPRFVLFHGTSDYCILSSCSTDFCNALREVGVDAEVILYEGKAHTDLFVQDPMKGGRDKMQNDLVTIIHGDDPEVALGRPVTPPRRPLIPHCMLKLATWVSPF